LDLRSLAERSEAEDRIPIARSLAQLAGDHPVQVLIPAGVARDEVVGRALVAATLQRQDLR